MVTWEEGMAREQATFIEAWLHKTSHETLHLSSRSIRAGAPAAVDAGLVLKTGATPDQLGVALMCVFWTYVQTLALIADTFELKSWTELNDKVVTPGFATFAAAGQVAVGSGV